MKDARTQKPHLLRGDTEDSAAKDSAAKNDSLPLIKEVRSRFLYFGRFQWSVSWSWSWSWSGQDSGIRIKVGFRVRVRVRLMVIMVRLNLRFRVVIRVAMEVIDSVVRVMVIDSVVIRIPGRFG